MSVEIPSDFALFVKRLVALPGFSQEFPIYIDGWVRSGGDENAEVRRTQS